MVNTQISIHSNSIHQPKQMLSNIKYDKNAEASIKADHRTDYVV